MASRGAGRLSRRRALVAPALALLALVVLVRAADKVSEDGWQDATAPAFDVDHEDSYVCFTVPMPHGPSRIVEIEPLADMEVVHHMLLFGCEGESPPEQEAGVWECLSHGVCSDAGKQYFLYGWGRNAPLLKLPDRTGFAVGGEAGIRRLVLQVHYLKLRPKDDHSGVRIRFSQQPTELSAGLVAFASYFVIPPGHQEYPISNPCCYRGFEPITTFAFRVHTHWMGRSVYLDRMWNASYTERLMENSPQKPQGFYPTNGSVIFPGDDLQMTCVFDSSKEQARVSAGPTHKDEMCNLYLMSYSSLPVFMDCNGGWVDAKVDGAGGVPQGAKMLVEDEDRWQPPPSTKDKAAAEGKEAKKEEKELRIGQVAGVTLGLNGTLWVFHRGDRVWDGASFRADDTTGYDDPIDADCIVQLDQDSGKVLKSFGRGLFYMPHMITLDRDGSLWVTDVGLHQALKLRPQDGKVLMELGVKKKPGHDEEHLCKPTQVAVGKDGTIYVSDGYCNSRVVAYDASGQYVKQYGTGEGQKEMRVPHSLLLDECGGTMLVADRENKRVLMFSLSSGKVKNIWETPSGYPYALSAGPYGSIFVLVWERDARDKSKLLQLSLEMRAEPVQSWDIPGGLSAPHDMTLLAAPTAITGPSERLVAVAIGETRAREAPGGSRLQKYILVPNGAEVIEEDGDQEEEEKEDKEEDKADKKQEENKEGKKEEDKGKKSDAEEAPAPAEAEKGGAAAAEEEEAEEAPAPGSSKEEKQAEGKEGDKEEGIEDAAAAPSQAEGEDEVVKAEVVDTKGEQVKEGQQQEEDKADAAADDIPAVDIEEGGEEEQQKQEEEEGQAEGGETSNDGVDDGQVVQQGKGDEGSAEQFGGDDDSGAKQQQGGQDDPTMEMFADLDQQAQQQQQASGSGASSWQVSWAAVAVGAGVLAALAYSIYFYVGYRKRSQFDLVPSDDVDHDH